MFHIYLYISMWLLFFLNIWGLLKIFNPLFLAVLGHFRRIFVYAQCMHSTFLVKNNFKSCFRPLLHQILSLCDISKSLKKFRVIESIWGTLDTFENVPFCWIWNIPNRLNHVRRSQHEIRPPKRYDRPHKPIEHK